MRTGEVGKVELEQGGEPGGTGCLGRQLTFKSRGETLCPELEEQI